MGVCIFVNMCSGLNLVVYNVSGNNVSCCNGFVGGPCVSIFMPDTAFCNFIAAKLGLIASVISFCLRFLGAPDCYAFETVIVILNLSAN